MSNDWSIDPKQAGSINDSGSKLPLGKSVHKIVSVSNPINKQDPSGQERQVLIETTCNGAQHRVYLNPASSNESVKTIAIRTLVAFWNATGQTVHINPSRLRQMEGQIVVLDVIETEGKKGTKNEGKKFTNISSVTPFNGQLPPEQDQEIAHEPSVQNEEDEDEPAPWLK